MNSHFSSGPSDQPDVDREDSIDLGSIEFTHTGDRLSKQIGQYVILKELGSGSMGRVYLAKDSVLERLVALKIHNPQGLFEEADSLLDSEQMSAETEALERFVREAKFAASLQHPRICAIFGLGQWRSEYFITMEYIEGESLANYLKSKKRLSQTEAVKLIVLIAEALDYSHNKNVLHRDLKPANVIMSPGGPVVTDFGMARHLENHEEITDTDQSIGTIAYMPLEQLQGEHHLLGPHSDVYSLGVMLFECLTGQLPFSGDAFEMTKNLIRSQAPRLKEVLPEADTALDELCHQMLGKHPDQRISTMREVVEILQEWLDQDRRNSIPLPFGDVNASQEQITGLRVTELRMNGKRPKLMTPDRPFLIGRDERGVDLRINRPEISRRHALLVCGDSFMPPTLIDLNSRRGIYMEGKPISTKLLSNSGEFQLGPVKIRYTCELWEDTVRDYALGPVECENDRSIIRKAMQQNTRKNELVRCLQLNDEVLSQLGGVEEARKLLPSIQHPNIAQPLSIFSNRDSVYVIQRWIHQNNLKQYKRKHGPLPLHLVVKLGKEISLALDYAESQDMIHGAISPETIYVSSRKRTILGDTLFPVNALEQEAIPFASAGSFNHLLPFYPPERVHAPQAYRIGSDLYSVGAILLWSMLSNDREFRKQPLVALERFIEQDNPRYDQTTRTRLGKAFSAALQPNPSQRLQSVLEFRQAWKEATQGLPV